MGMLFASDKTDAQVMSEAAFRSENIEKRIAELQAAIAALKLGCHGNLSVTAKNVNIHGVGHATVHLGVLPETALPLYIAALDEAFRLKKEIDAKLAAARKVLEA